MQKLNTQNVWTDLVNLLSPLPRMPMHVRRRGSTEVELPLAYYTFHGRGFGQGGGAAWPSRTEHRRQRNNPRGKNFLSLSDWVGLTSPSQDLHKNLEQSIELSSPLASFKNDSFEIQQSELGQAKISLRQKADMQRELISKKILNRKQSTRNEVYHPAGLGERSIQLV